MIVLKFIIGLTKVNETHSSDSTDDGKGIHQACKFLKLKHHTHSFYQ
jgi:hypothetical protein